ncbi:hypothetical protein [Candidatus Burkholderia verschuerenii]|uniref:hypothetical protein n=1 Tax=Candidatus Burkholderia verschuerenii TaxID=242163 RepID=UPI001E2ED3D1|nr:hypothetical protein [Candidatus Burkholderia verschuerenii]
MRHAEITPRDPVAIPHVFAEDVSGVIAVDGEVAADHIALFERLLGVEILRQPAGRIGDVIADRDIPMQALRDCARDARRQNVIRMLHEGDRVRIERVDLGGLREDRAQAGAQRRAIVARRAGAVGAHRVGRDGLSAIPKQAERHLAAAHAAAWQTHLQQLHARLSREHQLMHRLASEGDGGFVPFVRHARHARIGELGAGFAQHDVVEPRAVRAADQMDRRHAPAGIEFVADAGIHEQEIVIEMRDDGDQRAGVTVRLRRGGACLNRQQRGEEGPRQQ